MPHILRPLTITCALLILAVTAVHAQTTREPYQFITGALGYGAIRPSGETGLPGSTVDGDAGLQLGFSLHIRQRDGMYAYGRFGADVSDVRQHVAITLGLDIRPYRFGRWQPFVGFGFGALWLEPVALAEAQLDRHFTIAGEALTGVDWQLVPGIRLFGEYRLTAASFTAVAERQQECGPAVRFCGEYRLSDSNVLHLGHTGWFGLRIQIF